MTNIGNSLNLNGENEVIRIGFGSGKQPFEYNECLVFMWVQNSWDLAVLNIFSMAHFHAMESNSGEVLQQHPFFFSQDFSLHYLLRWGNTSRSSMKHQPLLHCSCAFHPAELELSWSRITFHDLSFFFELFCLKACLKPNYNLLAYISPPVTRCWSCRCRARAPWSTAPRWRIILRRLQPRVCSKGISASVPTGWVLHREAVKHPCCFTSALLRSVENTSAVAAKFRLYLSWSIRKTGARHWEELKALKCCLKAHFQG